MLRQVNRLFSIGVLSFSFPLAFADSGEVFSHKDPSGAEWVSYDRVVIPQRVQLSNDVTIRVHELRIDAPLVTAGHRLHLDVQKLSFGPGGRIIAFDDQLSTVSQAQPLVARQGDPGSRGEDAGCNGCGGAEGGKGSGGARFPRQQVSGYTTPGEILIFAAQVGGKPVVIGRGQNGAKGGNGGKGGTGGIGGKGGKAKSRWWPWSDTPAGPGGKGGDGGTGGRGGKGGSGGNAVAVSFLYGLLENRANGFELVSFPGEGGAPGDGGEGGDGGAGGEGGDGTGGSEWLVISDDEDRGLGGAAGAKGANGSEGERGDTGQPQPGSTQLSNLLVVRDYGALEEVRKKVLEAWYQFHWVRSLLLLNQESLRIAADREAIDRKKAMQENPDLNDLLVSIGEQKNRKYLHRVAQSWKNYFITPLFEKIEKLKKESPQTTDLEWSSSKKYSVLKSYYDLGNETLGLLQKIEQKTDVAIVKGGLEKLLSKIKLSVQADLKNALGTCSTYNKNKITLKEYITEDLLGATSHFYVPVCNKDPDFTKKENIFAAIKLAHPAETRIDGIDLNQWKQLIEPEKIADRRSFGIGKVFTFLMSLKSILLPDSYADTEASPYPVVLVEGKSLDLGIVMRAKPSLDVIHPKAGILSGYVVPTAEELTEQTLAYHLRALAAMIE